MDLDLLYSILTETTIQLRKGDVFEGTPDLVRQMNEGLGDDGLVGGGVLEIYAMPTAQEARPDLRVVDLHFIQIGVDEQAAQRRKADLIGILDSYPEPDRLAAGPSYIELGAEIGGQGAAFQLFALGKVLGIWDIITPAALGIDGALADQMAGAGYVMCTGYRPLPPAGTAPPPALPQHPTTSPTEGAAALGGHGLRERAR